MKERIAIKESHGSPVRMKTHQPVYITFDFKEGTDISLTPEQAKKINNEIAYLVLNNVDKWADADYAEIDDGGFDEVEGEQNLLDYEIDLSVSVDVTLHGTYYGFDYETGWQGSEFDRGQIDSVNEDKIIDGLCSLDIIGPQIDRSSIKIKVDEPDMDEEIEDSDDWEYDMDESLTEELIQSDSEDAFKKNVATEIEAGKPQKQALAIAYSIQKKNKKKKKTNEGFSDIESDFENAKKIWAGFGFKYTDLPSAVDYYNRKSPNAEPSTFYAKPLYNNEAWDEMRELVAEWEENDMNESCNKKKVREGLLFRDNGAGLANKGYLFTLQELGKIYDDCIKAKDPVVMKYKNFSDWMNDNVNNGYLEIVDERAFDESCDKNLKESDDDDWDPDRIDVLWDHGRESIIKDIWGYGISDGWTVNRFFITEEGKPLFDYQPSK